MLMYINRTSHDKYATDFYDRSDAADLFDVIDFEHEINDEDEYVPSFTVINGCIVFYAERVC